ncbi:hypothetical protein FHT12_001810 [Xanthomonas campestris]|uniref:Uncharacterized protein n=1 Tax=Xanthomonas euroxanthea TaxID=2259622 RepID=A0A8E4H3Z6_9XANT|nr:hypothetical protein [Xanthomonas euroxanthea]NIJ93113.1 hypothetical protein [Xanthomonas euroxanthea]CAD1797638.1 hypothetical protein XSP_004064 [Xanthomonas euroxanthea]SYZ57865.1 hypothetical protein CPBF367_41480 [Xanthomonas arboricola pv. juglandis]
MSALDNLSSKYLDEVSSLIPMSSVGAFLFGIAFFSATDESDGSRWLDLLAMKYERVWFLRDLLLAQDIWRIVLIIFLSLIGAVLSRAIAIRALSRGMHTNSLEIIRVFDKARDVSEKRGSEASFEVEATKSWRARRMRGVWNIFKMSSFLFSIGLISIASFKIIDVGIGISIVVLASFLSVRFSIRYLNACLPERIFLDSAVGLLAPKVVEELRQSVETNK